MELTPRRPLRLPDRARGPGHPLGDQGVRSPTPLRTALDAWRLSGLASDQKFIPRLYLEAGRAGAARPLRGLLLDTDGWVERWGSALFHLPAASSPRISGRAGALAGRLVLDQPEAAAFPATWLACGSKACRPHVCHRASRAQVAVLLSDKLAPARAAPAPQLLTIQSIEPTRGRNASASGQPP